MKIKYIVFLILFFATGTTYAQTWNPINGKTSFNDSVRYLKYRHSGNLDSTLTISPTTGNLMFVARSAGGGGYGVDSITITPQGMLCAWAAGLSTCYPLGAYYDSSALNSDSTFIYHYSRGVFVDSIYLPKSPIFGGTNLVIRDTTVTVNGNPVRGYIFDASGSGGGGSGSGIDSFYVNVAGDVGYFLYASGRIDSFRVVGGGGSGGGISKVLPGQYELAVNDSTTKVDSNFVVIKDAFFNPGVIPYSNPLGILTQDYGGLGYDGLNEIVGHNDPSTPTGIILNGSRAKIQAYLYGLRFQVGITGNTDPTKEYNFHNATNTTPYLRMYSTGTGPYAHHTIFNTDMRIIGLSTDSAAIATTGTIANLVVDKDGVLSWRAIPTPGSSIVFPNTATRYLTGYNTFGSLYDSARQAISVAGTGLSYNSTTGVITGSGGSSYTASSPVTLTGSAFGVDTTSGTAASLVTQYQRKKTSDSLLALIALRLNISDTAAMLSPYKTSYPRAAISVTTTGSGAATYVPATGVINIPTPAGGGGQVDSAYFWQYGGNAPTYAQAIMGTKIPRSLRFQTSGADRIKIDSLGYITYGAGNFPATATYRHTFEGTTKIVSITAAASDVFVIRNYLNSADLFRVGDDGTVTGTFFNVKGLETFDKFKDDYLTLNYSASDVSFAVKSGGTSKKFIGVIQNNSGVPSMQWFNGRGEVKVGGTTTNDSCNFQAPGSVSMGYTTAVSTTTMTNVDNVYTLDCTSGTFTVTLPATIRQTGRIINIVNSGAGTITIATASTDVFKNVTATPTSITIVGLGTRVLQGNGSTGWNVISSF